MSAVPPKAEVNPDIGICRDGVLAGWRCHPARDSSSQTGASNHALRTRRYEWAVIKPFLPPRASTTAHRRGEGTTGRRRRAFVIDEPAPAQALDVIAAADLGRGHRRESHFAHPEGRPWMWTVEFHQRKGRPGLHQGHVVDRESAMAAFRESWNRGRSSA